MIILTRSGRDAFYETLILILSLKNNFRVQLLEQPEIDRELAIKQKLNLILESNQKDNQILNINQIIKCQIIRDILESDINKSNLYHKIIKGWWIDAGTPESIEKLEELI